MYCTKVFYQIIRFVDTYFIHESKRRFDNERHFASHIQIIYINNSDVINVGGKREESTLKFLYQSLFFLRRQFYFFPSLCSVPSFFLSIFFMKNFWSMEPQHHKFVHFIQAVRCYRISAGKIQCRKRSYAQAQCFYSCCIYFLFVAPAFFETHNSCLTDAFENRVYCISIRTFYDDWHLSYCFIKSLQQLYLIGICIFSGNKFNNRINFRRKKIMSNQTARFILNVAEYHFRLHVRRIGKIDATISRHKFYLTENLIFYVFVFRSSFYHQLRATHVFIICRKNHCLFYFLCLLGLESSCFQTFINFLMRLGFCFFQCLRRNINDIDSDSERRKRFCKMKRNVRSYLSCTDNRNFCDV